jgi:hypothetical protein
MANYTIGYREPIKSEAGKVFGYKEIKNITTTPEGYQILEWGRDVDLTGQNVLQGGPQMSVLNPWGQFLDWRGAPSSVLQYTTNPTQSIQFGKEFLASGSPMVGAGYVPDTAGKRMATQSQIDTIKNQLAVAQKTLETAQKAGYGTGEIPADILSSTGYAQTFNLPEPKISSPNLTSAGAAISGFEAMLNNLQKERDEAFKEIQTQNQTWWQKIMNQPSGSEAMASAYEKIGVKPQEYFAQASADLAEVKTLMEQYNKAVEARDLALSAERERMAPNEIISARMSRVERDANIRLNTMAAQINTKNAIIQAKENNFTKAQQFVNDAVDQYTTDQKMRLDQFGTFYAMNKDTIDRLDKKYKDVFDKSFELAKLELAQKKDEMKEILKLAIEYPNAGWPSDLSQMTLAEATEIARRVASTKAPETQGDYYWDAQTKTWKPIGGVSGTGLSKSLQEDFAEDMASIIKFGSRETALTNLNNLQTALVLKYGQENYQKLLNEVDRLFPAPVKTKERPVVLPGTEKTYQAGQAISGFVENINKQLENLLLPIGEVGLKVESFFKGLFGK